MNASEPPRAPNPFRPLIHYTAARHWLNDPNGLLFYRGTAHLFYQHNPHGNDHGHMSWGHATSPDLLHWQERGVALPEREHQIFSGSALVDWQGTAGFGAAGETPLVACYTGHGHYHEAQYLAYSLDGGDHWRYAEGGPVLDEGRPDFRDPSVFWHAPSQRWVMALVHPDERQIGLYSSPDLHRWTPLSRFGPDGETAGIWEVPVLLPLRDEAGREHWLLKVDFNPGGPHGGSGAQSWLGDFDGTQFTARTPARTLDHGKDFYAAIPFSDLPGPPVWLAWMNNWQYAHHLPTHPWRGSMTLPRELAVEQGEHGPVLVQRPVAQLATLRDQKQKSGGAGTYVLLPNYAHELRLDWTAGRPLTLEFRSEVGLEVAVEVRGDEVAVVRPDTPAAQALDGFAGRHAGNLGGPVSDLQLILDTSSIEVFAGGGRLCLTDLLLPAAPIRELRVTGAEVRGELWSLRPCISH